MTSNLLQSMLAQVLCHFDRRTLETGIKSIWLDALGGTGKIHRENAT